MGILWRGKKFAKYCWMVFVVKRPPASFYKCHRPLAEFCIGRRDNARVANGRHLLEILLNFLWLNILSTRDKHIVLTAKDAKTAFMKFSQITCGKPSIPL